MAVDLAIDPMHREIECLTSVPAHLFDDDGLSVGHRYDDAAERIGASSCSVYVLEMYRNALDPRRKGAELVTEVGTYVVAE